MLVQGVPKRLRDPVELRRWFEEYQPCEVVEIEPVWDAALLKKHIEKRKEVINALNRLSNLMAKAEHEENLSFYARWQRRVAYVLTCCKKPEQPTVHAIMGQTCCGLLDCCTCCTCCNCFIKDTVKVYPLCPSRSY